MRACMFVKNSFEYDARVTKEAHSLIEAGHHVTVVAIHVPGVTAQHEITPGGIEVVRVSRLSFGMGTIQKTQARFVNTVEERNRRLTGEPIDERRLKRDSAVFRGSTATPGDTSVPPSTTGATEPIAPPGPLTRAWGWITTRVLRAVAWTARAIFRGLRLGMLLQGRAIKTWAINRRFVQAGLATNADVWHCHDLNTLYVGTRCKQQRPDTKLVYDSHELATERNRMTRWRRYWARWNERRGLPHADEVIFTTESRARYMVQTYGIDMPTVLRNVPELLDPMSGWDLRTELDIPDDRKVLVYQGSIQENRGIEESIEAAVLLGDCTLVVIGYGHHRPVLEDMVDRRGLGEVVKFFGPIPNDILLHYTSSADVGMCLIRGESLSYRWSLPNKLFEYMMAGVPIVASDFPEMGRVVREEQVGVTCDPDDPKAIAAAVRQVLDDPAAAARYRTNAASAITKYNWSVEEERLLELYRRLA